MGNLEKPQFHRYPSLRKYSFRSTKLRFSQKRKASKLGFLEIPYE